MFKYIVFIFLTISSVGFSKQIVHTETYKNGRLKFISYHNIIGDKVKIIKEEKYYQNGQKKSEVKYKNENFFSNTEWYENGQKMVMLFFENDEWMLYEEWNEDGSVKEWNEDGSIKE